MVGDPYETYDDPYCYPGTNVLKNLAGKKDAGALEAFELEMVALRAEEGPPSGAFNVAHYRAVHRHLFQDVYAWAGNFRTNRTGKGGNWFCYPEYISKEMLNLFERLKAASLVPGAQTEEFVPAVADFLAKLNAIHPFREGNGRTQLVFLRMLGQRAGHPFRTAAVEPDAFMAAMIASFHHDTEHLVDELERMLA